MWKKIATSMVVLALMTMVMAMSAFAIDKADAVAGAGTTVGATGVFTETTAGTDTAEGGDVTEVNLTTSASTTKWQGYYGQVTASLSIGSGTNVLYSFGSVPSNQIKTVFASTDTGFDFSGLLASVGSAYDTAAGWTGGDKDSAASTLATTNTIAQLSSVPAVALNAYTGAGAANATLFKSGIFKDTASPAVYNDFAWGVPVNVDKRDFTNSTVVDYELLVPVDNNGSAGSQTYYFFLDLE